MSDLIHKSYDEAPQDTPRASEPMTAYQAATCKTTISDMAPIPTEMDEWLRPMTTADIHRRIDESEADIAVGRVMTSQQVFATIERKYPWLCE